MYGRNGLGYPVPESPEMEDPRNYHAAANAPREVGAIESRLNDLANTLNCVAEVVESLQSRIAPVLSPEKPSSPRDGSESKVQPRMDSDLANRLCDLGNNAQQIVESVIRLRERVQL